VNRRRSFSLIPGAVAPSVLQGRSRALAQTSSGAKARPTVTRAAVASDPSGDFTGTQPEREDRTPSTRGDGAVPVLDLRRIVESLA
jgi:hypothetical protein